MELRAYGTSGLQVSAVGFGAGSIGEVELSDAEVARVLDAALDAGVTFFDTARSYGLSEERLGVHLAGRRDRLVLSTKIGYDMAPHPDWTAPCITAGIEAALRRLRVDVIDIVHLHSCPLPVLERGEVIQALLAAAAAGKVRIPAYSGEGDALRWAVGSGHFGGIQCSVSLVDQQVLDDVLPQAAARGLGVVAKRALGNAPWRFAERPAAPDVAEAWQRFGALAIDPGGLAWEELFARFAAHAPGVSSMLIGTKRAAHVLSACQAVAAGPLPAPQQALLRARFAELGASWGGRI